MEVIDEWWSKVGEPYSRYSVSTEGVVRNDRSKYILSVYADSAGYACSSMVLDGSPGGHSQKIHILVAKVFLGYTADQVKDRKICAHHINADKMDARLSNLEIVSQSDNSKHGKSSTKEGLRRPVWQLDMTGNFIKEYDSITSTGLNPSYISECCRGVHHSAYNSKWQYKPEETLEGEGWAEYICDGRAFNVSDMGRVIRPNGSLTLGALTFAGYRRVSIAKRQVMVHRLVCETFHPLNTYHGLVVNHINHVKHDNRASNLEWVTPRGNSQAYIATNPDFSSNRYFKRPVVSMKDGKITHFDSAADAAKQMGIDASNIRTACYGTVKTSHGYEWAFLSDYEDRY